jgi:hypothetical protein
LEAGMRNSVNRIVGGVGVKLDLQHPVINGRPFRE